MNHQDKVWQALAPAQSGVSVAATGGRSARQVCPACGSRDLSRIRRRPVDRLFSLFFSVYRYRCCEFRCSWEGNLRRR
ncbi:hypothetical protein [Quatrionicoccus australiensis]|uniref:hypothetical protein n=1 Tax=Quatrionicoccus australiensis TaxID=138118 RepID=UPI001CFC1F13|nr:hypothetical protein [Quatrionicoccus australiensis]MCB4359256.1 hypothetical protein [Quatrionicoccus australiensis]